MARPPDHPAFPVFVQDLESYNGTFVNGEFGTSPLPVHGGDEMALGPCAFLVSMLEDTSEIPAPGSGRFRR
jgi:pSer/pThr/pTyr-binding forkhead associated (FHA) protein